MLDNFVSSAGGFKEFAYLQDEDEKNGRETTKLADGLYFPFFPSSCMVCVLRDQSVFIMIARDSLSFGFSSFALL